MTSIFIIYKIRKELDSYQAHTWRLVSGYFSKERAEAGKQSLNAMLSPSEFKVGWTHEIQEVRLVDMFVDELEEFYKYTTTKDSTPEEKETIAKLIHCYKIEKKK